MQRGANPPNACWSNPCQNDGTCHNEGPNYRCECPEGFEGVHCENVVVAGTKYLFVHTAKGSFLSLYSKIQLHRMGPENCVT